MSNEPSFWRFATFNFLLYFFLLWLLSSQLIKFQIVADQFLYDDDVSALEKIAYDLGWTVEGGFNNETCNVTSSHHVAAINCNCSFENSTRCRINEISLISRGLTGIIPVELANLTYLQSLDLAYNELHGIIPAELGNLKFLSEIDLSDNKLTGKIPDTLGNLIPQLRNRSEVASQGFLTAGMPNKAGAADFSGGTYKVSQGEHTGGIGGSDLCAMFNLDLSNNQLVGPIPESLGDIPMNESLGKFNPNCSDFSISLSDNRLSGDIPASLGKLKFLNTLDLSENNLSGNLTETLGNLSSLSSLYLYSNNFTGPLPKSYGRLSDLQSFSISGNSLSGPFPDFITNWTSISTLELYGNNFQGRIPPEIFNLSTLYSLMISDVSHSSFQFPQISNLSGITYLVMRNCWISGEIPEYLFNVSSLAYLDLSFNNLTGGIPHHLNLTRLQSLKYMSLANNKLKGTIPAWIGDANWNITIDLSYNNFSNSSFELQTRRDLNFFRCCDQPIGPNMETNLKQMTEERCHGRKHQNSLFINSGGEDIGIDGHQYDSDNETSQFFVSPKGNWAYSSSGGFLSTFWNSSEYIQRVKCGISVADAPLYEKARLSPASLKYTGFCLRKGRYNITLHFAEIVFTEDEDFSTSMKRIFNVDIQGDRRLTDFNIKDNAGGPKEKITKSYTASVIDDGLLEIHLYWAGKGSSLGTTPFNGPLISAITVTEIKGKKLSPLQKALIALASIVFAALLLLASAWAMGWFGKEELHEINIGQEKPVTLKQLKNATGKFSKEMEIGKGSSGTVYRAQLTPEYNVAVKRVFINSIEGINKTKSEFYNSLQKLAHENLVRLFDVYVGKGVYLLIYEYMENRSLQDVLFGELKSKITLDWEARYNICLGIARGLKYLHEEHPRGPGFKMVHRGIKPANILLDGALKAKISDFGNSVLYAEDYQENQFDKVTKEEASSGYVAPEYLMYGTISYKYDVYGYGVVILEIVCGRRNAEQRLNKDELEYLVDEVVVANSQGRLRGMVDKNLVGYDEKEAMTILKLAVRCINISTSFRPTMSEVVSVLTGEKTIDDIWKPDSTQNLCQNCLKSLREDDGVVELPRA
ncbi:probable LRR receptor-like serine/threonine-protein kinase At1g53430 isoform X2 [Ziziphus jujuba]|uniref:non-specific serine/threonine protein kinase n=1 Tax=Ziziphus jujuba TaxID=326968 RepID=A0ABM3ZZH0_ZIZJJ|nr:probable LRR receptor-like serine/threonine-protein kinase At1g53430 isoform X2 [Ziziphus jujuba]